MSLSKAFRLPLSSVLTRTLAAAFAVTLAAPALAAPTDVALMPADGARFLVGQRFDIRVEGRGTGPFSASLYLDGEPQSFTSGVQNSIETDSISSPGYGGFNLRGFSHQSPGMHTLTAVFADASGEPVTTSARFEIIEARGRRRPAKNIIILLGDGMGDGHRTAARLVRYGVTAGRPNGFLAMEQFPGTGLVTTHSLNSIVTDSSPGMGCYSTGNHSANGQEGVYPAHVINSFFYPRVEYMAEFLHRTQGKSLGIVTTADVEDATPAANATHTGNRNLGTGICDQYLDESDAGGGGLFGTGLTVLMGGGRRWFLPSDQFGSSRSAATDYPALPADVVAAWALPNSSIGKIDPGRDLVGDFVNAGFAYADSGTALRQLMKRTPSRMLGLFGYGNMNVALDKIAKRRGTPPVPGGRFAVDDYHAPDQPMLDEMTEAALAVLEQNPQGFVLMVEGAHIDKQAHLMDPERVIDDTIEFDYAVAATRRFADGHPDTVLVVLADHECAGFSVIGALSGGIEHLQSLAPDDTTLDPTTQPGRQRVVGTYDAAGFPRYHILKDGYPETYDIDGKLLIGYGSSGDRFESWLTKPLPVIDSLLPDDIKRELMGFAYPGQPVERSESRFGYFLRGQATGRDQAVHTAQDISVFAYSSGSPAYRQFYGVQQNTDVFFKLMRAALGGY